MRFYVELDLASRTPETPSSGLISIETRALDPINPWDDAHALVKQENNIAFAEPLMDYVADIGLPENHQIYAAELRGVEGFEEPIFDENWASPNSPSIWYLGDDFSQLAKAYSSLGGTDSGPVIRVAHLDTGYDPEHSAKPKIRTDLQRNFREANTPLNANDPFINTTGISNPGHGTGTLGILGGQLGRLPEGETTVIGGATFIEAVPIRISNSVVLIKADAFVEAMRYVISLADDPVTRIHIVTMSMGGVASKAWAEIVNAAYDNGIFVVTAAGNNYGRATPRTLVYPARFKRVVAACGITFDKRPYSKVWGSAFTEMQGNFGPSVLMDTAIAAFTPNMPWAKFGTQNQIHLQGAGTSSATPQIAAAAALYWKKFHDELMPLEGWQQVEVIRQAMFKSADVSILSGMEGDDLDEEQKLLYFGRGCLRSAEMLKYAPSALIGTFEPEKKDKVSLPLWRIIFGTRNLRGIDTPEDEMYQIEVLQLIQVSQRLQELLDDEETAPENLNPAEQRLFMEEILRMKEASESLKNAIRSRLR